MQLLAERKLQMRPATEPGTATARNTASGTSASSRANATSTCAPANYGLQPQPRNGLSGKPVRAAPESPRACARRKEHRAAIERARPLQTCERAVGERPAPGAALRLDALRQSGAKECSRKACARQRASWARTPTAVDQAQAWTLRAAVTEVGGRLCESAVVGSAALSVRVRAQSCTQGAA